MAFDPYLRQMAETEKMLTVKVVCLEHRFPTFFTLRPTFISYNCQLPPFPLIFIKICFQCYFLFSKHKKIVNITILYFEKKYAVFLSN